MLTDLKSQLIKQGFTPIPSTMDSSQLINCQEPSDMPATDFFTWVDSSYHRWLINLDLLILGVILDINMR